MERGEEEQSGFAQPWEPCSSINQQTVVMLKRAEPPAKRPRRSVAEPAASAPAARASAPGAAAQPPPRSPPSSREWVSGDLWEEEEEGGEEEEEGRGPSAACTCGRCLEGWLSPRTAMHLRLVAERTRCEGSVGQRNLLLQWPFVAGKQAAKLGASAAHARVGHGSSCSPSRLPERQMLAGATSHGLASCSRFPRACIGMQRICGGRSKGSQGGRPLQTPQGERRRAGERRGAHAA